jgi:hypothetical protein
LEIRPFQYGGVAGGMTFPVSEREALSSNLQRRAVKMMSRGLRSAGNLPKTPGN